MTHRLFAFVLASNLAVSIVAAPAEPSENEASSARTFSNPITDRDEIVLGTNPTLTSSLPALPASWEAAVQADNPVHWLRFEETTTSSPVVNLGSEAGNYVLSFGPQFGRG